MPSLGLVSSFEPCWHVLPWTTRSCRPVACARCPANETPASSATPKAYTYRVFASLGTGVTLLPILFAIGYATPNGPSHFSLMRAAYNRRHDVQLRRLSRRFEPAHVDEFMRQSEMMMSVEMRRRMTSHDEQDRGGLREPYQDVYSITLNAVIDGRLFDDAGRVRIEKHTGAQNPRDCKNAGIHTCTALRISTTLNGAAANMVMQVVALIMPGYTGLVTASFNTESGDGKTSIS